MLMKVRTNQEREGKEARYTYEQDKEREKDWKDDRWEDDDRGSYFHEHGYAHLDIPAGHYPPPGECRIWYPDRPTGHQPPPGDCSHVPPGAWVIHHPQMVAIQTYMTDELRSVKLEPGKH